MKLLDYRIDVPTECTPVDILPFACVHLDNEGHSANHWRQFKERARKSEHKVILGLGDYYDWLRTHAREFIRQYPHDRNSFDRLHDWREERAIQFARDEIGEFSKNIAFLSKGNHHHEFPDGTNDIQKMCSYLKVQYGGHGGFLRLHIGMKGRGAHITLRILYHHGEKIGGGSSMGGDLNALIKKSEGWDFDVIIAAHNHKKQGTHVPIVGIPVKGALELIEKPRAFIRAGCFMKGYVRDCVTYAEAAGLMNPTALGGVRLEVLPKKAASGRIHHEFEVHY